MHISACDCTFEFLVRNCMWFYSKNFFYKLCYLIIHIYAYNNLFLSLLISNFLIFDFWFLILGLDFNKYNQQTFICNLQWFGKPWSIGKNQIALHTSSAKFTKYKNCPLQMIICTEFSKTLIDKHWLSWTLHKQMK